MILISFHLNPKPIIHEKIIDEDKWIEPTKWSFLSPYSESCPLCELPTPNRTWRKCERRWSTFHRSILKLVYKNWLIPGEGKFAESFDLEAYCHGPMNREAVLRRLEKMLPIWHNGSIIRVENWKAYDDPPIEYLKEEGMIRVLKYKSPFVIEK